MLITGEGGENSGWYQVWSLCTKLVYSKQNWRYVFLFHGDINSVSNYICQVIYDLSIIFSRFP